MEEEEAMEEAAAPLLPKSPLQPSQQEIAEHEASGHVSYRSWCKHCVAGKSTGSGHRTAPQEAENAVPTVSADYAFMWGLTMLVLKDRRTKSIAATAIDKKGTDPYAAKFFESFVRHLGYRKLALKSDQEPAILALKNEVISMLQGVEADPIESPEGDHQANGDIENAVREVKRMMRTTRSSLEEKLGKKLADNDPLLTWMPRYCADLITRYRRGPDGKTSEQRRSGKQWRKTTAEFGERVWITPVRPGSVKDDAAPRAIEGLYLGHHSRTGAVMVMTSEGIRKGMSFRKMTVQQAWDTAGWSRFRGLPWRIEEPRAGGPANAAGDVADEPAITSQPVQLPRRMYILRADIERHGVTEGCAACTMLIMQGRTTLPHSEGCRNRVGALKKRRKAEEEGPHASGGGAPAQEGLSVQEGQLQQQQSAAPLQQEPAQADADMRAQGAKRQNEQTANTSRAKAKATMRQGTNRQANNETWDIPATGGSTSSVPAPTQTTADDAVMSPIATKRTAETPAEELDPRVQDIEDLAGPGRLQQQVLTPPQQQQMETETAPAPPSASSLEEPLGSLEDESNSSMSELKHELCSLVFDKVAAQYEQQGVSVTERETMNIVQLMMELSAVDVAEVFSPRRFTAMAGRFGLRPGFAADLETGWDLLDDEQVEMLEQEIIDQDPFLLTGSPPCEAFSPLLRISKGKRDPAAVAAQKEKGLKMFRVACRNYRMQYDRGRYFLHEHPWPAESWNEPEMQELLTLPGVRKVKGPMCRWDMRAEDKRGLQGEGFVRKETGWVTNCPAIAEVLEGVCSNYDGSRPWHRHIHLIGGLAKAAQVYPPKLVAAVLKALKRQLIEDGELNALDSFASGPYPEHPLIEEGEWNTFFDDVNGTWLNTTLVKEARKEEIKWVHDMHIYDKVPRAQMLADGMKPVSLRWIDTNKGDDDRPNYRSRLVAREIKAKKKPHEQIPASQLFSAMPPLEAVKFLCSLMMSKRTSSRGKPLKLGFWDISRAHFYGNAVRKIYIELPEEDAEDGMVGILRRSMYGTQDASNIWQSDYMELLTANGYERGKSNGAIVYNPQDDARGLVHGDDFAVLADEDALNRLEEILRSRYQLKRLAVLGPEDKDDKEVTLLNRVIRYVDGVRPSIEYEPDARHAAIIVAELGLTGAKGVETPAVKKSVDEQLRSAKSAALSSDAVKLYRSLTMRAAYLGQDRSDIAEAVKRLSRHMSSPHEAAFADLKRLGRYLIAHPHFKIKFPAQKMPEKLKVFVDTDHAGCAITRKSTTGLVMMLGCHCAKTSSNLQSTVSLSSGESEYYGLVKGGAVGLSAKALFEDWGLHIELEILSDSSAARGFASRIGLGKLRHVMTRFLWLQERLAARHLQLQVVPGTKNCADVLTKTVSAKQMKQHMMFMNVESMSSTSSKHKRMLQS